MTAVYLNNSTTYGSSTILLSNSTSNGSATLVAIAAEAGSDSATTQSDLMPLVNLNLNLSHAEASVLNGNSTSNIFAMIIISAMLVCLIVATIVGNVFVISAILLERSLRTVGNYLVFSLAVTDLMVSCLVMPIAAIYSVRKEWNLGTNLCEIWTFVDVLCCTASIFHLLAIACDRFWAVTTVDYIHRRKGKHVCLGIGLIWIFSAIISLGPMLGWKDDQFESRIVHQKLCLVSQAMSYQVFATIFSFYAPAVLLLLLYYRIYQVAKTRIALKKQRYKYRIRRRPSFYRPRKSMESETIKELPSACLTTSSGHRSSLNPADDYFSSSAIPGTSSSGVYSSSTATDFTTVTTNTLTSDTSPNSLSPLAIVINDPTAVPGELVVNPNKRLSIAQFLAFQQQKQSDMCEQYVLASTGESTNEPIGATTNERRASHVRHNPASETTIMMTMPQSNIVVYVDDFASYEEPLEPTSKDEEYIEVEEYEVEDEEVEVEEEEEDDGVSLDDPTAFPAKELVEEEDEEDPRPSTNVAESTLFDPTPGSQSQVNGVTPVATNGHGSHHTAIIISPNNSIAPPALVSEHRRASTRKSKKKKGKNGMGKKKLQFRRKITRFDSSESKQESKAAKTLTIITGVFFLCWTPFFLCALYLGLCKDCSISRYFFDCLLWLGYSNSACNPILYTAFSPDFRNAFKRFGSRIFGQKKKRVKRQK